jgi:hypothetical protein
MNAPAAAGILLALVVAPAGAAQSTRVPAWPVFEAIRLGGPIDEVLAAGGSCHSVTAELANYPGAVAPAVAPEMFAYSLPHGHALRDSNAVRAALAGGTMCFLRVLEGRGRAMVLAFDRTAVAATVYFVGDSSRALSGDSVRTILGRWPPPTHRHPQLDTWYGARYRAYLVLVGPLGQPGVRLYMVDAWACSSFDRRLHRAAGRGRAEAC